MAIAAGEPAGKIQRGRGGFMRSADDKPYVTDPTGALVKGGERKGQPKRLAYGSPSSRGKQIENTFNLQKWGERRVVMGIGVDLALIADCHAVAQLDPESSEFKEAADRIVIRAKDAAQASLAAERGTHGHALTEDHDEERDWIARAEAGEILGLDVEVQRSLVQAWRECIERNGLEILAVEAACVDDAWRLAGTLDRIARTTRPLRFALITGEVRTIPADTVLVLDVKSGKRKTDRDGSIIYWHAYSVQIASYAQSVPYDTEAETRGEWPWPISQEHALIAHLDVLGAIDGNPSCELVYVDLVAGREHGGATVVAAKEWEARKDVFSVAQLDDEIAAPGVEAPVGAEGDGNRPEAEQPAVEVAASTATIASPDAYAPGDAGTSTGESPASPVLTPADQHRALDERGAPDEGGPADPSAVMALETAYHALDAEANAVIRQLVTEAQQGRVPFHLRGNHTVRRFEIVRGLVAIAPHVETERETLRCVLAAVVGDVAHFANVTPGHVLGTLSADEAALFARLCDEFVAEQIPTEVDEATGHVVLRFPSLAAAAA
jgi:hypothetical protein